MTAISNLFSPDRYRHAALGMFDITTISLLKGKETRARAVLVVPPPTRLKTFSRPATGCYPRVYRPSFIITQMLLRIHIACFTRRKILCIGERGRVINKACSFIEIVRTKLRHSTGYSPSLGTTTATIRRPTSGGKILLFSLFFLFFRHVAYSRELNLAKRAARMKGGKICA